MMFQIEQNFGGSCKSWIYFETEETDKKNLTELAKKQMQVEWKETVKMGSILHVPVKAQPTISVAQYDSVIKKKVKGGIRFKTKWR